MSLAIRSDTTLSESYLYIVYHFGRSNLAVEGGLTESCVGLAGTLAVTASLAQRDGKTV